MYVADFKPVTLLSQTPKFTRMQCYTSFLKEVLIGDCYLLPIEIVSQDVHRTWYGGGPWLELLMELIYQGYEEKCGCPEFSSLEANLTSTKQGPFLKMCQCAPLFVGI